jgi:hypothetical protein
MIETPDFHHLVVRDLTNYLRGRGFPLVEAERRAKELMVQVDRIADEFRSYPKPNPSHGA